MIICAARALNEEANVERFIERYSWIADLIIIGDGGSTDRTVEIAMSYDKVKVLDCSVCRYDTEAGHATLWPVHKNLLLTAAESFRPDWIIHDELDCVPGPYLMRDGRSILANSQQPVVTLYRLYVWGNDEYMPKYNQPGQSQWAWKPAFLTVRGDCATPMRDNDLYTPEWSRIGKLVLEPPHVCLHYFAPSLEAMQRKIEHKAARGITWNDPRQQYGPPEPLPEWARNLTEA